MSNIREQKRHFKDAFDLRRTVCICGHNQLIHGTKQDGHTGGCTRTITDQGKFCPCPKFRKQGRSQQ